MAKIVRLLRAAMLALVAVAMALILMPLAVTMGIWDLIRYGHRVERLTDLLENIAYATDIWGNIAYQNLLNVLFSKREAHLHGDVEPITSALGKKWTQGLNTFLGEGCVGFLNAIDKLHCWKYIEGRWPARVIPPPVHWKKTVVFCVAFLVLMGVYWWVINWIWL